MINILATIKKIHLDNIVSGVKKYEIRKSIPKRTPFLVELCESGSGGQVRGNFTCFSYTKIVPHQENPDVLRQLAKDSCVSISDIFKYAGNKPLYFWHISDLNVYEPVKKIQDFYRPCIDKYEYCQSCKWGHITYPSWVETYEDLCDCVIEENCTNYLKRAPQSWCYLSNRRD